MVIKYLLSMYCGEQGYWDTSGYCHWKKSAYHGNLEFGMDQEDQLIQAIASFIGEYPQGDYEIYVIQSTNYWNEDEDEDEIEKNDEQTERIANIIDKSRKLSKEIAEKKRVEELEARKKKLEADKERQRQKELELLAELKAKYGT